MVGTGGYGDPMPSDKLMKLFIIQAISSFVAHDFDSGLHYLNEIKASYAEHMMSLNPTLKLLAKEIIQSLDMFTPGASAQSFAQTNQVPVETTPSADIVEEKQPVETVESSSVASELQNLLNRRRAKRAKRRK